MTTNENHLPIEELLSNDLYRTLLQDILAYPETPVSLRELDHFNPGIPSETLYDALSDLAEYGILHTLTAPLDNEEPDSVDSFYYLTPYGTEELTVAEDFLESVQSARKYYNTIETPQFKSFLEIPRPPLPSTY